MNNDIFVRFAQRERFSASLTAPRPKARAEGLVKDFFRYEAFAIFVIDYSLLIVNCFR